jgi:hypothetical protein
MTKDLLQQLGLKQTDLEKEKENLDASKQMFDNVICKVEI